MSHQDFPEMTGEKEYQTNQNKKTGMDVSVIVATYEPIWEKLRMTLMSIILQKNVSFEIIVADDGSSCSFAGEAEELFSQMSFRNYAFANQEKNVGTVCNLSGGIEKAKGKYVKMISPGDYFYAEDTLSRLVSFAEECGLSVSFSDCVFYNMENGERKIRRVQNSPRKPYLFDRDRYDSRDVMEEYLLMGYNIIGASFFARTDIVRRYLEQIVGKVKYLEDYMYKLMVVDGIMLVHQPEITVWYEYAVGITVSKDPVKQKRMQEDAYRAYKLVEEALDNEDWFARRLKVYIRNIEKPVSRKIVKALLFPLRNLRRSVSKDKIVYTKAEGIDDSFLRRCAAG